MDLSILIVNWNTHDVLRNCLSAIYKSNLDINFEVIVVDNNSSDDSIKMVRDEFPSVKIIENKINAGFAAANNQAYRSSSGRYILLLNPDAIVYENTISVMLNFLSSNERCAIVAPRLLWADGSLQPSIGYFPSLKSEIFDALYISKFAKSAGYSRFLIPGKRSSYKVQWASGACLLIKRIAIANPEAILDESYYIFSEEADLCKTLYDAHWEVWLNPEAEVMHIGSASTSQNSKEMLVRLYESKFLFFAKHSGNLVAQIYRLGIIPLHVFMRLIGYLPSKLIKKSEYTDHNIRPDTQFLLLMSIFTWKYSRKIC